MTPRWRVFRDFFTVRSFPRDTATAKVETRTFPPGDRHLPAVPLYRNSVRRSLEQTKMSGMRAVVQRVARASVSVGGEIVGSIGPGLLVLLAIGRGDGEEAGRWLCDKIVRLRVFEDEDGRMNRSVEDAGGGILVISQFTLYGDARKGNRPGFDAAAPPEAAEPLFEKAVRYLRTISPVPVATGRFRARMAVELVNDGPVTLLLERGETGPPAGGMPSAKRGGRTAPGAGNG
jgi:D-tyrosyl-tRNA(Tyr) deacylase